MKTENGFQCDYQDCKTPAVTHATFDQAYSGEFHEKTGGVFGDLRIYHYDSCDEHLTAMKNDPNLGYRRIFELGDCDNQDCIDGTLSRINSSQN